LGSRALRRPEMDERMGDSARPGAGGRLPADIDEAWITDRLDRLWPAHNASLAELLIVLRGQFDGDLDAMLILTVLSVGARTDDWARVLAEGVGHTTSSATNTQSIADITGIPRESVRRKMKMLARKGWVSRDDAGRWQPNRAAARDLKPSSRAAIRYFERIFLAARDP
jgi:hypothetical protein